METADAHCRLAMVTGAPRSGTTAMVRWLGTQPQARALGEVRLMFAAYRFLQESARWKVLMSDQAALEDALRQMVLSYSVRRWHCKPGELLVHKEPLEAVALPQLGFLPFLRTLMRGFPEMKYIFMVRAPLPAIESMMRRKWGYSRTNFRPRDMSIESHIKGWCAAADCLLALHTDPRVLVCPFSRLLAKPADESRRIRDFLSLGGSDFEPRPTARSGLDSEHKAMIVSQTEQSVLALRDAGIELGHGA